METKTFAELGLSAKVQEAIIASGYTIPTPIQAAAIPVAMQGRDVLGIAQTGTGKTASFTLPMISRLETGRARARMPRSLILAPTRELAAQVAQSFEKYGVNHKLDVALLIGGVSMDEQTKKLDRGVDVLIATPGRLLDHFGRGRVMLMGVEILVIDEADRMLDMGFIPDIEKICKLLPPRRQTLFFSATMPAEITRLVHQFQKDPVRIEVAPPATSAKTITQKFCYIPSGEDWDKREALRGLLRQDGVRNAILFCNRKVEVAILLKSLVKHGFNAGALHGDMEQRARTETLDKFRSGEIAFLAASDVAARGLDIPDVSHVFNFDLPRDKDDYVHRIGRTGRAGKEGHSTSLVTPFDLKQLQEIEKMSGEPVVWVAEAPTEEDYAQAGKRKRGRGGPPSGASRFGARNGGRERPMPVRGAAGNTSGDRARGGERPAQEGAARPAQEGAARPAQEGRERPAHGSRERSGRPDRSEAPVRREALNTGQRRPAPGLEPQPVIGAPIDATNADRAPRSGGEQAPRQHAGRGMHRTRQRSSERSSDGPRDRRPDQRPDHRPDHRPAARAEQRPDPRGEQPRQARDGSHEGSRDGGRAGARDNRRAAGPRAPSEQSAQGSSSAERGQRGERGGNQGGGKAGFTENVPAFLQKPTRPAKIVSE